VRVILAIFLQFYSPLGIFNEILLNIIFREEYIFKLNRHITIHMQLFESFIADIKLNS